MNKFETFEELILIVSASINFPLILSNNYIGIKIKDGYYYDGFFTSNTPILYNSPLPQLVMKTHKIEYSIKNIFNINDNCVELLIFRGFIEGEKFLNGEKNLPFEWIDKNLKKKNKKNKSLYLINLFFIIINTYKYIVKK